MRKTGATREGILDAARYEFAHKGYAGASMRCIADATRVTKATVYHHFPNKATLFRETMKHTLQHLHQLVIERTSGIEDPLDRLRALLRAKIRLLVEERDLVRQLHVMFFLPKEVTLSTADIIHDHTNPVREALLAIADKGYIDRARVDDLAMALIGAIEYTGAIWMLDPAAPKPSPKMADRLLALLIPAASEQLTGGRSPRPRSSARSSRSRRSRKAAAPGRKAGSAARGQRPARRRLAGRVASCLAPLLLLSASTSGLVSNAQAETVVAETAVGETQAVETAVAGTQAVETVVGETQVVETAVAETQAAETVVAIPGTSQTADLFTCIQEALELNAELQSVRSGREELAGQMIQARAIGLPSLDLSGTWTRGRDPSFALDKTFAAMGTDDTTGEGSSTDSLFGGLSFLPAPEDIPAQTFWRASLNAHWEIQPGLIYNAITAAGLGIKRQELIITDAEQRTIEEVMRAYHAVVLAGGHLAALDADLSAKREFLDATRHRLRLGLSTPLDTLRAAVAHANLLPQRRGAVQRLRDEAANLNVLMGRPPRSPLAVETEMPLELDPIDPDLTAASIARRPDIQQLDTHEQILRKNRGAIKSEHRPSLSADAAYGYVTSRFEDLTDTGHDFWNASLTLTVPLFDGMRTKGRVQEAEASIRRTRHQREEALRRARQEVLSIRGDLQAARQNYAAAALNLAAAEDALEQIGLRYELGKADYLSVLNIQADRFIARCNLIQARNEVLTLTATLKRALGFAPTISLCEIMDMLQQEQARESNR